jgi:hypothetical protein
MSGKTWFSELFGFLEHSDYEANRKQFEFDENTLVLTSIPNRAQFYVGPFECPTIQTLHERYSKSKEDLLARNLGKLQHFNVRGDVRHLHTLKENHGSVFMVASQFNVLEMVGPGITPEKGITGYISDKTQGPACALACPGATAFRNYMVNGTGKHTRTEEPFAHCKNGVFFLAWSSFLVVCDSILRNMYTARNQCLLMPLPRMYALGILCVLSTFATISAKGL